MIKFGLAILLILGVLVAPFMTMGAVMIHYGHQTLGIVLLVLGVINMFIKFLTD